MANRLGVLAPGDDKRSRNAGCTGKTGSAALAGRPATGLVGLANRGGRSHARRRAYPADVEALHRVRGLLLFGPVFVELGQAARAVLGGIGRCLFARPCHWMATTLRRP